MNNIVYAIIEEKYNLGNESRISYGISAFSITAEANTATIVASVHDITSNRDQLVQLVDCCNTLELSTKQLVDVVDDFLSN